MKGCELCNGVARMYCESDQASLCWDCDEKVHCANFLVAKHSRSLLCQICQSPTAWKASGPKLGPTVSICESCFFLNEKKTQITCDPEESRAGDTDYLNGDSDEDDEDEDAEEEEEEEEEEEGENQVVPWSVTSPTPPVASSSSSEDISSRFSRGGSVLKRMRENSAELDSDDDDDDEIGCSSSSYNIGIRRRSSNDEGDSVGSERPLKQARRSCQEEDDDDDEAESRSTAIIESLKRLQTQLVKNRENASQTILGICRLSTNHSTP